MTTRRGDLEPHRAQVVLRIESRSAGNECEVLHLTRSRDLITHGDTPRVAPSPER